jgi:predicted KAP-like P-loop ATPase
MQQFTDRAIEKLDQDQLGRRVFAEDIARRMSVCSPDSSLVYAIYGGWGTGKSSILHMVEEALTSSRSEETAQPITIRFNPWYYSDLGVLISAFFETVAEQIGKKDITGTLKSVSSALSAMSKITTPLAWIPGIGRYGEKIGEILGSGARVAEAAAERTKGDLVSRKDELSHYLIEAQQRIVVFVDDIDRLTNVEIRQIFQLVKSLADLPYIAYLLAFDDEIVARALDEPSNGHGREYLEKIIQVPLPIPATSRSKLRNLVGGFLEEMIETRGANQWDQSYWDTIDFIGFWEPFSTMRDCYRYLNALDFYRNSLKDEINLVDLWTLTLIQVFYPNAYKWLSDNKGFLTQDTDFVLRKGFGGNETDKKAKAQKFFEELRETISTSDADFVEDMVKHIFPSIGRLLGHIAMSSSELNLRVSKRVGAPENFDRYFRYGLADDEVTVAELAKVISASSNAVELESQIKTLAPKASDLFDRIEDRISEFDGQQGENIVQILCTIGDDYMERGEVIGGVRGKLLRIILKLLRETIPLSRRHKVLASSTTGWTHGLMLFSHLLNHLRGEHNPGHDGFIQEEDKRLLTEQELDDLEKKLSGCLEAGAASGQLEVYDLRLKLVYHWRYLKNGQKKAQKFIRKICDTNDGLLSWLRDHAKTMYARDEFAQFFDKDDLTTRLYKLYSHLGKNNDSPDDLKMIIEWSKSLHAPAPTI